MRNTESAISADQEALVAEYQKATAERPYYQAIADTRAMERRIAVAKLSATGLSFQAIADLLGLGTKARVQQLVEDGRAALANPAVEAAKAAKAALSE